MKHLFLVALCTLLLAFPQESFGNNDSITTTVPSPSSTLVNLLYKDGRLNIKGLTGVGTIRIYSIIGNAVAEFQQVDLFDFERNIDLERKTMYIVRIEYAGEIQTYKLVTR